MTINLNTNPYYDDFDETKNYVKILFKPSYAVQARELTQLQTALQKQISNMGSHFFKDGSIVLNGNTTVTNCNFIDLTVDATTVAPDVTGKTFVGQTNGATAKAISARKTDSTTLRLYFVYTSGATLGRNETILSTDNLLLYTVKDVEAYAGTAITFSIIGSVFFVSGYFVYCNPQTVVLAENTTDFTLQVGLVSSEVIKTSEDDATLLDPSQGSFNFAAPGADRLAIELDLVAYETTPPDNFIELSRFRNGEQIYKVTGATYSEIENTLARRTYDESGDYTVKAFVASVVDNVRADNTKLSLAVGPGKAYIKGYEFETIATTYLDVEKAREYQTRTNVSSQVPYGDYLVITAPTGTLDYTANVEVSVLVSGGSAGTTIVEGLERESENRYRLYVSSLVVSSGFAISNITGFTFSGWSALVDTSFYTEGTYVVKSTDQTKLIPVGKNYVKTLLDDLGNSSTEYESIYQFNNQIISSNTITVSAASGQEFFSTTASDYIVETGGVIYQPQSVSITPTSATLSFGTLANGIAAVIAPVVYSNILQKNKSLQSTSMEVDVRNITTNEISLGLSDCYKLISVYAVNSETLEEVDITGSFEFNNGQKHEIYDFGTVTLKENESLPNAYDKLRITFEYFTPSVNSGFFSVDSYNPSEISYENIPSFVSEDNVVYRLTDYLDFRKFRQPNGSISGSAIARPRSRVSLDYSFYLARIDKLVLTKERKFDLIKGISAELPSVPADIPDSMTLYTISLKPYTATIADVSTKYNDNRRYTMRDIGAMQKRIDKVEYYTALSILEKQAVDEKLYDDLGVERFKNGILVDSFTGHSVGDVNNYEYLCAIDAESRTLRPRFSSFSYQFDDSNLGTASKIGDLVTLPTTGTEVYLNNPYATSWVNLNPYLVFNWNGTMKLNPATDNWVDTQTRPRVNVNLNGENDVFTTIVPNVNNPASIGTKWNDWQTVVTGVTVNQSLEVQSETNTVVNPDGTEIDVQTNTVSSALQTSVDTTSFRTGIQIATSRVSTVTRDLGTKVVDISISPYIRSRTIQFASSNMKPLTRLFASFDNTEVTDYCAPAFEMVLPSSYTIDGSATEVRTSGGSKIGDILLKKKNRLFFLMRTNNLIFAQGESVQFYNGNTQVGTSTTIQSVVTRTELATNEFGDIAGTFLIPNTDRIRFTNGEKMFRLADTLGKNCTTAAETRYVALGMSQSTEQTVISTRVASVSINPVQQVGSATTQTSNSVVTSSDDSVTDVRVPTPPARIFASDDESTGDFSNGTIGRFEYVLDYTDVATTSATGTIGGSVIQVLSPTGIKAGMTVTGTGIAANTTVSSISGINVTLSAPLTSNVSGTNNVTFTNIFDWVGIKYTKTNVPVRYTLNVNGVDTTTGFVGSAGYNTQLVNLGLPRVAGEGTGDLFVRRPSPTVTRATLIVESPIDGSGWAFRVPTPKQTQPSTALSSPVYAVASSVAFVNEGGTVTFAVATRNVPDSQALTWEVSGTTTSADFTTPITGSLTLVNGRASVPITLRQDAATEGEETFEFVLYSGASVVARSRSVRVIDTSLTTSYSIQTETGIANEGDTVNFVIQTEGVTNGTVLFLTFEAVNGTVNTSDFVNFPFSVVIQNNTANVSVRLANDRSREPEESFLIRLRTGSSTGAIVATSNTVSIVNTSSAPTWAITADKTTANEGSAISFIITTTSVDDGTVLYWDTNGTVNAADFEYPTSGAVTIQNNTAVIIQQLVADLTTEGVENFTIRLRLGSITGTVVASSQSVFVADTSIIIPQPSYTINSNNIVVEGGSIGFTVIAQNVANGTTLYWTTTGTAVAGDFVDGVTSGSIVVNNNTAANITRTILDDATTEGVETFALELRTGSTGGTIVGRSQTVSIIDTSTTPGPVYGISSDKTQSDEGSLVTFSISTQNVANGTTLYWTTTGTAVAGDFFDGVTSGSVVVNNNSASVTRQISIDATTEGDETFALQLRTGSTGGTIVATSQIVTIKDTSLTPVPVYSITANKTSIQEPDVVTFAVATQNVSDGTVLYWTTNGSSAADFEDTATTGSVTVNNNTATITRSLVLNGTPVSETFFLELRTTSVSGTIVATSQTITVRAPTPAYRVTVSRDNYNEGDDLSVSFHATGIVDNSTYYWTIDGTTAVADFGGGTSGNFQISSGQFYAFTMRISADQLTEGREEFVVNMRTGSTSGTIVATSRNVVIDDTSVATPRYNSGAASTSVEEGQAVNVWVAIFDGPASSTVTVYPSVIPEGNATSADFVAVLLDPVVITTNSSGTGSTPARVEIATDLEEVENNETFRVNFYSDVGRTQLLTSSNTVTIVNTTPVTPSTLSAHLNYVVRGRYNRGPDQRLLTALPFTVSGYWEGTGAYRNVRYAPQARPFVEGAWGISTTPSGYVTSGTVVTAEAELIVGTLLDNGGTRDPIVRELIVDWIPEDTSLPTITSRTNIVFTIDVSRDYLDPVAQSFYVDSRVHPDGIFIESVDLYFRSKSDTVPVTVQLRPNVNGYPSSNTVIPFGVSNKEAALIETSTDGSVATNFVFDNKVYLAPGEYSVVVIADSNEYEAYTSVIGEFDIVSEERVTTQPTLGSLFKSQNTYTWTAVQEEDLKFRLHKSVFNDSAISTAEFETFMPSVDASIPYELFNITGEMLDFARTNIDFEYQLPSGQWTQYQIGSNVELPVQYTLSPSLPLRFRTKLSTQNKDISPVVDLNRLQSIFVHNVVNNNSTDETLPFVGKAESKYVTRTVNLAPGFEASDLVVFLYANTPPGASFEVYYRIKTFDDIAIEDNNWVKMNIGNSGVGTSSNFIEYKYVTPYTVNGVTRASDLGDRFSSYAIKIVMKSSNPAYVPKIRDLRVIAIDD